MKNLNSRNQNIQKYYGKVSVNHQYI